MIRLIAFSVWSHHQESSKNDFRAFYLQHIQNWVVEKSAHMNKTDKSNVTLDEIFGYADAKEEPKVGWI